MSAFQPGSSLATENLVAAATRRAGPARRRFQRSTALSSSRPFLADAGSGPGNRAGMEEATGAPSSFAALSPRRLRASSRDGGGVVNRPPSSLTMLLSRHTRRRTFLGMAGGLFAPVLPAQAQPTERPLVGFLSARSPDESAPALAAFREGLGQTGYFEGRNVALEYRWAEGQYGRLPTLARELADRPVAVIAATGGGGSGVGGGDTAPTHPPPAFTRGGQ